LPYKKYLLRYKIPALKFVAYLSIGTYEQIKIEGKLEKTKSFIIKCHLKGMSDDLITELIDESHEFVEEVIAEYEAGEMSED
jgi:hypothetical protein